MARTREGAALTEAHRLAQVALSQNTAKEFLAVWRLLDPSALNATFPEYARLAKVVIDLNRSRSTDLAAAYLSAFRQAEGATAPLTAARAGELAKAQALTSLTVTGPVTIRQGLRAGKPLEKAAELALVSSVGAVRRHVLQAGRETISGTVQRDEEAVGVARVTDGRPCAFCAMVASRGAVYKSEMSAAFEAHDHCGCTSEPVYGSDDYLAPGRSQEFADLWESSTAGKSGNDARIAFRRALEGRA